MRNRFPRDFRASDRRLRVPLFALALVAAALVALASLACKRSPGPAVAASPGISASSPPRASIRLDPKEYAWTEPERRAVEGFLRVHPDLRPATDDDRSGSRDGEEDMRHLYGIYHPYFVRGDVNDDGRLDFVLAFVRRDPRGSTRRFSIVVFAGRDNSDGGAAFEPGLFVEREVSLAHGDLAIDRDAVLVTPDLSDDAVRRYRWDPAERSYVLVRDENEEVSVPAVSET